jgi:hypothetical protein
MHRVPSYVVDQIPDKGRFPLRGGDGTNNTLTQMPGTMNDRKGVFEWIVNSKCNYPIRDLSLKEEQPEHQTRSHQN